MSEKMFISLLELSAVHAKRSREVFQKLDLSSGQPKVLYVLNGREGYLQKELADVCKVEPPSLTVLLNSMEKKGYIRKERVLVSGGKRAYRIYLTDQGREIARMTYDRMEELEQAAFQGFSEEDKKKVFELFARMKNNLS